MAKKKINNALRDQFLIDYGISPKSILFEDTQEDIGSVNRIAPIFRGDTNGNMLIYYPTLELTWGKHYNKANLLTSYRTRLKSPFLNNKGELTKYLMEGKNLIFFPPEMLKAYTLGTEIEMLIVTEGEKKAFVGCKNGFDVVGISGIWNFCRDFDDDPTKHKELMPELKAFISKCKVKKIVLLHDSDALDISNKYFNEASNKSATERPNNFFQATKQFAELVFQEGCQFYHSYINPHLSDEKLGLDDLIQKFETHTGEYEGLTGMPVLSRDLYEGVYNNKFTSYFQTTQIQKSQNSFIKIIFKINDAEDFFKHHKKIFKKHNLVQFRFEQQTYELNYIEDKIKAVKVHEQKSVWEDKGRYYAISMKGETKCISNFTMNVLFLLKSGTNPKRIVEFANNINQKFVTEMTMDEMVSVTNFRKNLIAHGSFIFKGDMPELLNLQEWLFREEKVATELISLGWQNKHEFFAFSNGVTSGGKFYPVDEYGVVNYHGEKFYLPAYSNLLAGSDEGYDNERKFKHDINSTVTFEEWSKQYYTVYQNNGAISICYGVAAIFFDIIFHKLDAFPILNNFGVKGSGKSTASKSLMYLFGSPQKAISLESESSTKKGTFRKFMQFRNALVWLDEYKNTIDKKTIGLVKGLFDGHGYEKAQTSQDNRTHSTSIHSATILSGQDMPTIEAALLSRVILNQYLKTKFTEPEKLNMDALNALEEKGLTSITVMLIGHRALIADKFDLEFNYWFGRFSEHFKYDSIDTRLLKSSTTILSPVAILVKEKIIEFPIDLEELFAKFIVMLKHHKEISATNSETQQFWDVIQSLYNEKEIGLSSGEFRMIKDAVAIKFTEIYSKYAEKFRKMYGRNGIEKTTLQNYLKNSAAFIETKDQVKFGDGQNTSAYLFHYKKLGINLERESDLPQEAEIPQSTEKIPAGEPLIFNTDVDDFK